MCRRWAGPRGGGGAYRRRGACRGRCRRPVRGRGGLSCEDGSAVRGGRYGGCCSSPLSFALEGRQRLPRGLALRRPRAAVSPKVGFRRGTRESLSPPCAPGPEPSGSSRPSGGARHPPRGTRTGRRERAAWSGLRNDHTPVFTAPKKKKKISGFTSLCHSLSLCNVGH